MHLKDSILSLMESLRTTELRHLLYLAMQAEPKRPISLDHFTDCLNKLVDAKHITFEGQTITLIKSKAA